MTGYVIFEVKEVFDSGKLQKYKEAFVSSFTKYGGELMIGPGRTKVVEGDHFEYVGCVRFGSFEQAELWYSSSEYTAAKKIREGAANVNALIVEGKF